MSSAKHPQKKYALSFEPKFAIDLVGLPRDAQKKVIRALEELQADPSSDSEPLKGSPGIWRRRVGSYRLLFASANGWIHAYKVAHRQGVYAGGVPAPSHSPHVVAHAFPEIGEELGLEAFEETEEQWVESSAHGGYIDGLLDDQGLDHELKERIKACRSAEELLELVDSGLPDPLFDLLTGLMAKQPVARKQMWTVRLIKRNVIDEFFGAVVRLPRRTSLSELTIVTPWITSWVGSKSSFAATLKFIRLIKAPTVVVTRPPKLGNHIAAVQELSTIPSVEIVQLPNLHAKYFVCDMAPGPFAMVGSANATEQSLANFEVGVLVKGVGEAEGFVRELQSLSVEMRSIGRRIKRKELA